MPRPKTFEREAVLDQAMTVFWRHGYAGASVADLVAATGVQRQSLYDTFGDKGGLFRASVERYRARVSASRMSLLSAPGAARDAIQDYFEDLLVFSAGDGRRLGCLLTNSAVEFSWSTDDPAGDLIAEGLRSLEAAFHEVIVRGQRQGEFPADHDPRVQARCLTALVQGLRVLARSGAEEETLRDAATGALATLGPSPTRLYAHPNPPSPKAERTES